VPRVGDFVASAEPLFRLYGGTATLFLAAWDSRVRAAVVSGYFNEWQECHRMPWNLCGSQVLPGMLGEIEHAMLALPPVSAAAVVFRARDGGEPAILAYAVY